MRALALTLALLAPLSAHAETIQGPVEAEVIRVKDGDTLEVLVRPWFRMTIKTGVRIQGIEAPPAGRKPACAFEAAWAEVARQVLERLAGNRVTLTKIHESQYAKRVVADVESERGDLAELMLKRRVAKPWDGRGEKPGWCE